MEDFKSETDHLQSTIETIESGIEKESMTGASPKITSWIKTLQGHRGFTPIVHDLEKLKEAIAGKDSNKVYTLLEKLGNETIAAAEKAEGKDTTLVKKLGKTLLNVSKLAKKVAGEAAN